MFIRVQNLKRDEKGVIASGSASVYKNTYDPDVAGGHCRQVTVLSLGKILWINDARDNGIFDCKDRGIVEYDLKTNTFSEVSSDDERLKDTKVSMRERMHTTFGDAYLFFSLLDRSVVFDSVREAFPEEAKLERVLIHVMYGCIRNHSAAKCGQFLERSMASYLFKRYSASTLNSDSDYFEYMGDDNVKKAYFTALASNMRKQYPDFGRACYVDSTPLPNESQGFPYKAICSHGTDGLVMQARLALVLDIETGVPVWFQVFSSNILDHSNLHDIQKDVRATLGIDIDIAALDAGYACKELFNNFNIDNNTYVDSQGITRDRYALVRMPQKNGYPHDELYLECKPRLYSAVYLFDYDDHAYYGERFERCIFGYREYCYVFLDRKQAEELGGKWRAEHAAEWKSLCDSDKEWYAVKDGFFILIGAKKMTPKDALIEYKARGNIEGFFKDGKSYVEIMPLESWTKPTILGKILHDVIQTTMYRQFRKEIAPSGTSVKYLLTELQSLDCVKDAKGHCEVFTPKKQVREYYQALGYTVPAFLELDPFRDEIMKGTPMDRTPLTVVKKRAGTVPKVRYSSPEEKERKRRMAKESKAIEAAYKKAEKSADTVYERTIRKAKAEREKTINKAEFQRAKASEQSQIEDDAKKAEEAYNQVIAEANSVYDQKYMQALKLREDQKRAAKKEYETAIAELTKKYESH